MCEHICRKFRRSDNPFCIYVTYDSTDASMDGYKPIETWECIFCNKRRAWLPYYAEIADLIEQG